MRDGLSLEMIVHCCERPPSFASGEKLYNPTSEKQPEVEESEQFTSHRIARCHIIERCVPIGCKEDGYEASLKQQDVPLIPHEAVSP